MAVRRRPLGPKGALVAALIFYAVGIVFVFNAINSHSQAGVSSFVQAHGVQDNATVINVDNITHHSKNNYYYTAQVNVQLQNLVDGVTTSVVYVPHQDNSNPGDTITVLVDPSRPSYAELPGTPNTTTSDWIWPLVWAAGLLILGLVTTVRSVRLFRQRGTGLGFVTGGGNPSGLGAA